MSPQALILHVAVPTPLRRVFDYRAPEGVPAAALKPGMRLRVPYGHGQAVGVLLDSGTVSSRPVEQLKPALELLDEAPLFTPGLLRVLHFAADYYHHPIGEVAELMLPAALRAGAPALLKQTARWQASAAGLAADLEALARKAPKQAAALSLMRRHGTGVDEGLLRAEELAGPPLKALVGKGLVEPAGAERVETGPLVRETPPALSGEQAAAVAAVRTGTGFRSFLLEGITGSGKTEVYLQLVADCVAAGRQALILVPEIGLTPQTVQRFEARFSCELVVLHSGLSDGERLAAWLKARSGQARIVLGTRSALFTPLPQPGLVIVDEEHDLSYKQQDGLRYSARDLALVRARSEGLPIVLGSATPALESLHQAQGGRHGHLRLTERAGEAKPPRVGLIDVRKLALDEGLSAPLLAKIREHLDGEGQVLLFLNRRGFSPVLLCHGCGWVAECRRCDARYTLHQEPRHLHCHHCDSQRGVPARCPDCGEAALMPLGLGTERLEERLRKHFPDTGLVRIDRDSTRRKGSLAEQLEGIHSGRYRLLVGTQMLAKGHHFPDVTLVALPDMDSALFSSDFRAAERLAQLVTQVAGRAGRAARAGEVVLQTHQPEHPLLHQLLRGGYAEFARSALGEREAARLPPFRHLALLRAEAMKAEEAMGFLAEVKQAARELAGDTVQVLGPAPAPMERRAGRYRAQLLLEACERRPLHALLDGLMPWLETSKSARKVRWSLDVDPQEMM
ncbi:MAG: primosomal protein N' [Gammaproteobacteria bacterium]|nr:primosomal protein N' [Gammaproteobacteria bacterium]